jgi:hypothetical protein
MEPYFHLLVFQEIQVQGSINIGIFNTTDVPDRVPVLL